MIKKYGRRKVCSSQHPVNAYMCRHIPNIPRSRNVFTASSARVSNFNDSRGVKSSAWLSEGARVSFLKVQSLRFNVPLVSPVGEEAEGGEWVGNPEARRTQALIVNLQRQAVNLEIPKCACIFQRVLETWRLR